MQASKIGDLFNVNTRNEYTETIIAKCFDFYIAQRVAFIEKPEDAKPVDARLESIVNRMIERCLEDGQYRQALGIALETRRMDIFEASIMRSDDVSGMLAYAYNVTMSLITNRAFRNQVLRCLVGLYRDLGVPDYVNMCQCLIFLEDPLAVAEVLDKLTRSSVEANILMAYQIAFDMYESATQEFLGNVLNALKETAPIPAALPTTFKPQGTSSGGTEGSSKTDEEKAKDLEEESATITEEEVEGVF